MSVVDVPEKVGKVSKTTNALDVCRLPASLKTSKRFLRSDEAHVWLTGYVNKQNCRIWSEANPQVYVETPLHPEKLTVWCALWAGGILLQKR
ncbi:putative transposase [Trichonephila clavipes]|nr:putative transposase [Trichonephila clavipes]